MKKLLSASLAGVAFAAAMSAFGVSEGAGTSHFAMGVIQQTDREARVVLLAHQPSAAMPAMTMQFAVAYSALFERMPAGQQLAFEFVELGGDYRIVNAIPLAQASGPAATEHGGHEGMQRGKFSSGTPGMRATCEGMMERMHGGRHQ